MLLFFFLDIPKEAFINQNVIATNSPFKEIFSANQPEINTVPSNIQESLEDDKFDDMKIISKKVLEYVTNCLETMRKIYNLDIDHLKLKEMINFNFLSNGNID